MLALVTGASGFVGSHLCGLLRREGHAVRALVRPGRVPENLAGLDVEIVRGELTAPETLPAAVQGVDWVFHLAAALKGFREEDLARVNVGGTRALVEACLAAPAPPRRFVHVSSLAAGGPSPAGGAPRPAGAPDAPLTWYGRTKLEGEKVVAAAERLTSVICRPAVVFGPRERDVLQYFQIARRGFLPVLGRRDRHYSLVYGPDLALGLLRAAQAETPRAAVYDVASPEVVTWRELGLAIAAALGKKARVVRLPEWVAPPAGAVADLFARIAGKPQIFSSQKVVEMRAPAWVADTAPAARDLGFVAPTPLAAALAETAAWYREHGWL